MCHGWKQRRRQDRKREIEGSVQQQELPHIMKTNTLKRALMIRTLSSSISRRISSSFGVICGFCLASMNVRRFFVSTGFSAGDVHKISHATITFSA